MSKNLEDFARNNRDAFDSETPSAELWSKINDRVLAGKPKARLIQMAWFKWSVAAATIIMVSITAVYLLTRPAIKNQGVDLASKPTEQLDSVLISSINPEYAQELYHFTRLIELKQDEIKQLEKDNPSLYKEFITDINSLDSSYNRLKEELPTNPNREQLLEAMISNLQIQMNLLNQQLQIIQQIKQSKSSGNEKNAKNI